VGIAVGDLEAQGRGEVLFVADHDIDIASQPSGDLLCTGLPTEALPEAGPVVEVVGDDCAVALCRGHSSLDHVGCLVGQPGVDSAGVEPAGAELTEQSGPVDVRGAQLCGSSVTAIGHADGAS